MARRLRSVPKNEAKRRFFDPFLFLWLRSVGDGSSSLTRKKKKTVGAGKFSYPCPGLPIFTLAPPPTPHPPSPIFHY